MALNDLKPYFKDGFGGLVDHGKLAEVYKQFVIDFIENPITIKGKPIKIYTSKPKPKEYHAYCESFFHIVTHKSLYMGDRYFEDLRANRVHWIRPMLASYPSKEIMYYKAKNEKGICNDHFWYFKEHFMVVLHERETEMQLVSAFCLETQKDIDDRYEKWDNYKHGKSGC